MSLRKYFKRLGRKTAKVNVKIGRVLTPVVSVAAGFVGGPALSAAVTAGGAAAGGYWRATQARNEGQYDRARALGRGERKRVAVYGAIGGGAGSLGSGAYTLATGGTITQAIGTTFLGQGGAQLLGVPGHNFFGTATQNQLAAGQGPFGALNPAVSGTQLSSVSKSAGLGSTAGTVPAGFGSTAGSIPAEFGSTAGNVPPGFGSTSSVPSGSVGSTGSGILGTGVSWSDVGTGALGLGYKYLNRPAGTPDNGSFVTHDDLAGIMSGLFGGGGGGNGGDGDGSGKGVRDSDTQGGSLMPLLLLGGLLFVAS